MPVRGDDLEAAVVAASIKHLANVDVIYTEQEYASSHPNSKSIRLDRTDDSGGIYETLEVVGPSGEVEGIRPQLVVNESEVPNYSQGARVTIVQHELIYEVAEVDDSRDEEVVFVLRKLGAA
jgi:hypothetical protein